MCFNFLFESITAMFSKLFNIYFENKEEKQYIVKWKGIVVFRKKNNNDDSNERDRVQYFCCSFFFGFVPRRV